MPPDDYCCNSHGEKHTGNLLQLQYEIHHNLLPNHTGRRSWNNNPCIDIPGPGNKNRPAGSFKSEGLERQAERIRLAATSGRKAGGFVRAGCQSRRKVARICSNKSSPIAPGWPEPTVDTYPPTRKVQPFRCR